MSTESGDTTPGPATSEATVNATPKADVSRDISSLANFRARQSASSAPKPEAGTQAGEASPNTGATPQSEREQFIPRPRFDEVVQERNQTREQLAQMQAQMAMIQAQQQQPQVPQNITGMQGNFAQPAQTQSQTTLPDFNDPTVKKQWSDRMYKNPLETMRELVSLMIRAEGEPLLNQFQQQIVGQIAPLRQTFAGQQVQSYEQSRASDPIFGQIAPNFRALANQAATNGIPLNAQTLQAIEGIARAQAGVPFSQPQAAAPTFTERPGGQANFGQSQQVSLTPEQLAIAKRYDLTPEEYAGWYGKAGVK